jgi:hypothetical protein
MEEILRFNRANAINQETQLPADIWARKSNHLQDIIAEIDLTQDSPVILTTIAEEITKENKSTEEAVDKDQEIQEKDRDQETEADSTDKEDIKEAIQKKGKEVEERKTVIEDFCNMIQTQKYTINLKIYSNSSSFKLFNSPCSCFPTLAILSNFSVIQLIKLCLCGTFELQRGSLIQYQIDMICNKYYYHHIIFLLLLELSIFLRVEITSIIDFI